MSGAATPAPGLTAGDIAPACVLPSLEGTAVDIRSDAIAGNPLVLLFCPTFSESTTTSLKALVGAQPSLNAAGARVFVVTLAGPDTVRKQQVPFPVLLDRKGDVFRSYGARVDDFPTTVVVRPNQHVMAIVKSAPPLQVAEALERLEQLAASRRTEVMTNHPPVLLLPDVLSRDECRHLETVYDTRGQQFVQPGPGVDYVGTDYKMHIPEHGRVDRVDHWVVDRDTEMLLQRRVGERVLPEIVRVFQYRITKWERMRIGCYHGQRGGKLHGHRDNVEPTPYRRFAMSINLNTEKFTGGELRFPEFGDQRYRPESGTAIVFSSSLLHEALEVTSGRRLVVLAFLFGDS